MATPTYTPLATYTVPSGGAASVTFSSIPASYRDLVLIANFKTETNVEPKLKFNGDTTSSYSMVQMAGNGSATLGNSGTTNYGWITPNSGADAGFSTYVAEVMEYSATDKHTTWLSRFSPKEGYVNALANRWAKTEAINEISFFLSSSNFSAESSFSIYGIEA